MLQYSPDSLQWMLLVSSNTLGLALVVCGLVALTWALVAIFSPGSTWLSGDLQELPLPGDGKPMAKRTRRKFRQSFQEAPTLPERNYSGPLWVGVPAVLAIGLGLFLPQLASPSALAADISRELSSTAEFSEVKLLHTETVSSSPLAEGSVSFIGTAADVDGDPRQFRYTQYRNFGIYEMVGFDKPAVDLKDTSFESVERGLELYGIAESSPES